VSPILGIYASQISGHLFGPTGAYDSIATTTVGAGGAATITFSSIPQTYTHLQLRYISNNTNNAFSIRATLNSDSGSNYANHILSGNGSSASTNGYPSETSMSFPRSSYGPGYATTFTGAVVDILDYSNTSKNKTARGLGGYETNSGSYQTIDFTSSLWMNTSAITNIVLSSAVGNFAQFSQFALYGVKGQ
jgi:hypothetical protein